MRCCPHMLLHCQDHNEHHKRWHAMSSTEAQSSTDCRTINSEPANSSLGRVPQAMAHRHNSTWREGASPPLYDTFTEYAAVLLVDSLVDSLCTCSMMHLQGFVYRIHSEAASCSKRLCCDYNHDNFCWLAWLSCRANV